MTSTLRDACEINGDTARETRMNNLTLQALKSQGKTGKAWDKHKEGRDAITTRWQTLKDRSEQSLKTAAALAEKLSWHLGPAIMTSFEELGEGICRVETTPQTTGEGIINSHSELSHLTGDHYRNRMDGSVSGGKVVNENPFCHGESEGGLLVDPARGMALIYRNEQARS